MEEQLRQLKRSSPFRPFVIALKGGRTYEIRARYEFAVYPDGTLCVADPEKEFALYKPDQLESVCLLDVVEAI